MDARFAKQQYEQVGKQYCRSPMIQDKLAETEDAIIRAKGELALKQAVIEELEQALTRREERVTELERQMTELDLQKTELERQMAILRHSLTFKLLRKLARVKSVFGAGDD